MSQSTLDQTTPEPPAMMLPPERQALVTLLSQVYRSVDWREQGGKNRHERWSGMLRVATRAETVGELVDNLCKRLGVGSIWQGDDVPALIATCEPHADALLDWADRETVPVAMLAYQEARA